MDSVVMRTIQPRALLKFNFKTRRYVNTSFFSLHFLLAVHIILMYIYCYKHFSIIMYGCIFNLEFTVGWIGGREPN